MGLKVLGLWCFGLEPGMLVLAPGAVRRFDLARLFGRGVLEWARNLRNFKP